MNKPAFLREYRQLLINQYPWAADAAKLDRFMASVTETLSPAGPKTWHAKGDAVTAAWRLIGGRGTPTLKALVALDEMETA